MMGMLFKSAEIRENILKAKKSKDIQEKIALSLMGISMVLYNLHEKNKMG